MDIPKGKSKEARQIRDKITECPSCPLKKPAFLAAEQAKGKSERGAIICWFFHLRNCGMKEKDKEVKEEEQEHEGDEDWKEGDDAKDPHQTRAKSKSKQSKPKTKPKRKLSNPAMDAAAEEPPQKKAVPQEVDEKKKKKQAFEAIRAIFKPVLDKLQKEEEELHRQVTAAQQRLLDKVAEREKVKQNLEDMEHNLEILDEMANGGGDSAARV